MIGRLSVVLLIVVSGLFVRQSQTSTQVLVRLKSERSADQYTVLHRYALVPGLALVRVGPADLATLKGDPGVLYVEPDQPVSLLEAAPNDPLYDKQWGLYTIHSWAAWRQITTTSEIPIAVVDSGVDYLHEDLAANIWRNEDEDCTNGRDDDNNGYVDDCRGWDFWNGDNDPMDEWYSHGSMVAGTICAAGNNRIGIVGVAWRCRIMPVKGVPDPNAGRQAHASDLIANIEYAVRNGARISNFSWRVYAYQQALYDTMQAAQDQYDHLFVVAAGNNGQDNDITPTYPASYDLPAIIAVAASGPDDRLWSGSNYGAVSVDLAAPGVDILATRRGDAYGLATGTSLATPYVTGAAGLLMALHPEWTTAEVKAELLAHVRPAPGLAGRVASGGVLDLGYLADKGE